MENFADLMQRLLEVQSGGRQRSPRLIEEDKLERQSFAGQPSQMIQLSQSTDRTMGKR
jgi:hypothetical protein